MTTSDYHRDPIAFILRADDKKILAVYGEAELELHREEHASRGWNYRLYRLAGDETELGDG